MARLCLYGKTPPDCLMYVMQEGKPVCLSSEQEVVVDVAEGEAATIFREKPLSPRGKALAALGIFLTAPIQAALQQDTFWEDKIPYDIQVTLTPRKDTACTIGVTKPAGKYQPPRVTVSGDGVVEVQVTCKPCPQILNQAWFVYLSRLLGMAAWGWVLMGVLLWAGLKNGFYLGAGVAGAVSLGILGVCLYAWKKGDRVRKDSLLALEKIPPQNLSQ